MKVRSTRTRASKSIDEIGPSRDQITPSFLNQTIPSRHAKTSRKCHSSRWNLSSSENPPTRPSRRRGRLTARRVPEPAPPRSNEAKQLLFFTARRVGGSQPRRPRGVSGAARDVGAPARPRPRARAPESCKASIVTSTRRALARSGRFRNRVGPNPPPAHLDVRLSRVCLVCQSLLLRSPPPPRSGPRQP